MAYALMALDLPAFERPAKAISGGPAGGNCERAAAPITNVAPISTFGGLGTSAGVPRGVEATASGTMACFFAGARLFMPRARRRIEESCP